MSIPPAPDANAMPTQAIGHPTDGASSHHVAVGHRTSRWRRLLFWSAFATALGAVVAGTTVAADAYRDQTAPERVVLDYLGAVARGDAAAALAYGDLPAADMDLLTDEVLAAQLAIAAIDDVTVEVVIGPAAAATAEVDYVLGFADGARAVSDTIALTRGDDGWRLASAAVPVALRLINGSNRATVAGAEIPGGPQLAFPGALPVEFDTENLTLDEQSRVVRFAQEADVQELVELSATGEAAVAAALDGAVAACLDGTAETPALCPLPADPRAVPGTLRGTPVEPASQVGLIRAQSDDGQVMINAELIIDGEYQRLDFNNQRAPQTENDLAVSLLAVCFATSPESISWRLG